MATSGSKSVAVTSWDTLKFSWETSSQSITNNTSTISWKLQLISTDSGRIDSSATKKWSVTVNGETYSGTNTVGIANNTTKTLASGTTTIAHNSNGTKTFSYSFSQQFSITFDGVSIGTKSGSGSGTLNTIARKSSLAASNGTLGTAQTLTVTRHDSSLTHTITYKCGSAEGTIATKSSNTSISWTPPLDLASQSPSGTSVSITFTITTYSGSTSIGSNTKAISCSIPSSVIPTVSITVSDASNFSGTYGGYIQHKSKIKVVITSSGSYGSTIKATKTTADGNTYTAASFTTGAISGSGTLTVATTVTDSRGRTATTSKTVTVLPYSAPKITAMTVKRCDSAGNPSATGGFLSVVFNGEITSLSSKNTATYTVQYKKTSESSYTSQALSAYTGNYSVSGGAFVFEADSASTYDVILAVKDSFETTTKAATGASIFKVWSIFKKGLGFAFGKIAELEGVFDVGFKTRFSGGILHPVLVKNTDLNDVKTPNTYVGANVVTNTYENCPITKGTFTLEVLGAGVDGQVKQRLSVCSKTESRIFERFFFENAWGEWICVSDYAGTLLWNGGYYMTAGHTINFSESVAKQKNGIVLVFSEYFDDKVQNQSFKCEFIPKKLIMANNGASYSFFMTTSNHAFVTTKYMYIHTDHITGHENNNKTFTNSGITTNNSRFVLRYVIGV